MEVKFAAGGRQISPTLTFIGQELAGQEAQRGNYGGEICRRRAANFTDFSIHRYIFIKIGLLRALYLFIYIYIVGGGVPPHMRVYTPYGGFTPIWDGVSPLMGGFTSHMGAFTPPPYGGLGVPVHETFS